MLFFDSLDEERATITGEGPPDRAPRTSARRVQATERRLRRAIAVVAAATGIVVAALIGSVLANDTTTPATSANQRPSAGSTQPAVTVPPTDATTTTTVVSTASTPPPPATTTPGAAGPQAHAAVGPPVLMNLRPSSGMPGQSVEVSGSGFLSPSGRIIATVGGRTASVRCPDQTTCTVRIPLRPRRRSADPVVVITDRGSSNPLAFRLR